MLKDVLGERKAIVWRSLALAAGCWLLAGSALGQVSGKLSADPNPVQVCDGGFGVTTISWTVSEAVPVQVFVNSVLPPGRALFSARTGSGSARTGRWVRDGLRFFLVEEASGQTLDELVVGVTAKGCPEVTVLYPQVALGGGFQTVLVATNLSEGQWTGSAQLHGQQWADVPWSINGQQALGRSSIDFELDPGQTRKFVLSAPGRPLDGWIEIIGRSTTTRDDTLTPQRTSLSTAVFLNLLEGGNIVDSTGLTSAGPVTRVQFPVERGTTVETALVLRRATESHDPEAPLNLILKDSSGMIVTETEAPLGARLLGEIIPDLPDGFVGSLDIRSEIEFRLAVFRLELTPSGPHLSGVSTNR